MIVFQLDNFRYFQRNIQGGFVTEGQRTRNYYDTQVSLLSHYRADSRIYALQSGDGQEKTKKAIQKLTLADLA